MAVRLTPKSSADRILGIIEDGPHGAAVKVAVTAPPADGKANAALIQVLARHFGVPPRDLSIVGGGASRNKLVEIAGDPAALARSFEQRLAACPTPS